MSCKLNPIPTYFDNLSLSNAMWMWVGVDCVKAELCMWKNYSWKKCIITVWIVCKLNIGEWFKDVKELDHCSSVAWTHAWAREILKWLKNGYEWNLQAELLLILMGHVSFCFLRNGAKHPVKWILHKIRKCHLSCQYSICNYFNLKPKGVCFHLSN